ncbi:hypothetical protein BEP19_15430 [Ammoniphilus oxalaticus]|uniref:Uncharacterized protein n=1 Tax=Ammoniphilus oxalaticus TaxID=66863 RepID=A0A419SD92_9BACL|nr:hypothetical protein [Ammoniphilus oxalaticus]RKD21068.1 hypothetical protein BEP19_15430 [Ammoniphilus oxalaticus]
MKRFGVILGLTVAIVAAFIIVNKSYYPPLPINNLSAKEVIGKLKKSDEKIVKITENENYIWYITRTENEGILIANENIKQMIGSRGWKFKEQNGAGLFFEKEGEGLIVTTQMWTKKYVLVQAQNKFMEREESVPAYVSGYVL